VVVMLRVEVVSEGWSDVLLNTEGMSSSLYRRGFHVLFTFFSLATLDFC